MKKIIIALMMMQMSAFAKPQFVTVGSDTITKLSKSFKSKVFESNSGVSVLEIDSSEIESLSHFMHEKFYRCGGFIAHDSLVEARNSLDNLDKALSVTKAQLDSYTIDQEDVVHEMLKSINEFSIRSVISKLESFHNRFYKASSGVESSTWIKNHWQSIIANRSDAKVELFKHRGWPQPSVILTIEGSESPNEIVIIGGHADSISGLLFRSTSRAPGADDNASGVATFTEVLRVLMENNFKPKRTIQFMAYAAEEVGLLGSKDIANRYKAEGKEVVGVLQLDMTNFHGSKRSNIDITLTNDFTNAAQNEFIGKIIDTYVQLPWAYSECGYACSDHASWTAKGYPASAPFESTKKDMNKKIHTSEDLLSNSGGNAFHAEKFAKLALAYAIEMAN